MFFNLFKSFWEDNQMKKILKSIFEKILYLFLLYTIGVFFGCLFHMLRLIGTVRILHKERIPHGQGNMIIISNHPSLLEPILLPLLFFGDYIRHPFKLCPISIPDKENYMDKWYWWWLRFCAIPIDRKDKKKGMEALHKMKNALNAGRIIIPFAESSRTCWGKLFAESKKGKKIKISDERNQTMEGAGGISWLIKQTNPLVLFMWIAGAENILPNSPDRKKLYHTFPRLWKKMTIKIGEPIRFSEELSREEIAKELTIHLLNLADEEE